MLRNVYVNDILPMKAKNTLGEYRSETARTATTKAKRSGKKRDMSEVICHNCKVKGHNANKCLAKKPLPGDTTTKWCSRRKTRPHSDNAYMAQQGTPQSPPPCFCTASDHFPCRRHLFIYLRGNHIVFVH